MSDSAEHLELGAAALGLPLLSSEERIQKAAIALRIQLDNGKAKEDMQCDALLQLINSTRLNLASTRKKYAREELPKQRSVDEIARDIDKVASEMATAIGLRDAKAIRGRAIALVRRDKNLESSAQSRASRTGDFFTRARNDRLNPKIGKLRLLPRPSLEATQALLDQIRSDRNMGVAATKEKKDEAMRLSSKIARLKQGHQIVNASGRRRNFHLPLQSADTHRVAIQNEKGSAANNRLSFRNAQPPAVHHQASAPHPNSSAPSLRPMPQPGQALVANPQVAQNSLAHVPPAAEQQAATVRAPAQNVGTAHHGLTTAQNVANARDSASTQFMHQFMNPTDEAPSFPATPADRATSIRVVLAERERDVHRQICQRQAELVSLPMGVSEEIRRKAIIESKQMQLVELQRIVRSRVCAEMKKMWSDAYQKYGNVPADNMSRLYRRRNPPIYSYTDGYPKIGPFDGLPPLPQRPLQMIALDSKRMAHYDYIRMLEQKRRRENDFNVKLRTHIQMFERNVSYVESCRARICKGIEKYFQEKARAEERRRKQEQYERLRLLKSNDEQAYFNLLKNTKNERLLQLVRQTDNYLMRIGAQVEKMRDDSDPGMNLGNNVFREELGSEQVPIDAMRRRRDMYYTVTHAVTEEVEQPSIMVHGKLKPYQLEGLKWMVSLYNNNLNGILADEMGLGKTIQTIALLTYLIEKKKNLGPYLIIVPLSTLGNWVREMNLWAPSVVKIVYRGDKTHRRSLQLNELLSHFNVLLTTYEFVVKDQSILSGYRWKYIIIDEGHRMKNANCKLAMTLGVKYKSKNRLLLTGTPLQNNLTELWALLNFLLPSIFSSSDTFETWFNKPFESTTHGHTAELEEEETLLVINRLHQVLRPFLLRRLKADVEAQLPDKVESVIRCDMSAWQRVLYRQVKNKVGVATGSSNGTVRSFNNLLMQCKKICNHPYLFYGEEAIHDLPSEVLIQSSGKFHLLQHMIPKLKSAGHRTLIFSQMTAALDYLEDFLHAIGIQYMRLDGSTKADDRQGMLNIFNAPDSPYDCFLLSTRAGGLGLNLQTADTVIIFDSDWNPMMDLQAQDRAHRIGQTKVVRVFRLISSGTVEVKILEQANRKLQVDAQVIQAGQFNNKSTESDQHQMLKCLLRQRNDDDDQLGDVPSLEELNRIIARDDEEFDSFTAYDKKRENENPYKSLISSEKELPAWVLEPETAHKSAESRAQELMDTHGRGRRQRNAILDIDQFTELEWLSVMEGRATVNEVYEKRQQRRLKLRRSMASDELSDSGEDTGSAPRSSTKRHRATKSSRTRRATARVLTVDSDSESSSESANDLSADSDNSRERFVPNGVEQSNNGNLRSRQRRDIDQSRSASRRKSNGRSHSTPKISVVNKESGVRESSRKRRRTKRYDDEDGSTSPEDVVLNKSSLQKRVNGARQSRVVVTRKGRPGIVNQKQINGVARGRESPSSISEDHVSSFMTSRLDGITHEQAHVRRRASSLSLRIRPAANGVTKVIPKLSASCPDSNGDSGSQSSSLFLENSKRQTGNRRAEPEDQTSVKLVLRLKRNVACQQEGIEALQRTENGSRSPMGPEQGGSAASREEYVKTGNRKRRRRTISFADEPRGHSPELSEKGTECQGPAKITGTFEETRNGVVGDRTRKFSGRVKKKRGRPRKDHRKPKCSTNSNNHDAEDPRTSVKLRLPFSAYLSTSR